MDTRRIALVTGAGTGIGEATALLLAQLGATVVCCGRTAATIEQTVANIQAAGGEALAKVLDVTDEAAFKTVVDTVVADLGRIDVLVNNAGYIVGGMIDSQSNSDWNENFRVCLDSIFYGTKAVLPYMQAQVSGAIVNVSSVCGMVACMGTGAYSAAKSGVISFTKNTAIEGAPYNVRANVVSPGVVMTPATELAL